MDAPLKEPRFNQRGAGRRAVNHPEPTGASRAIQQLSQNRRTRFALTRANCGSKLKVFIFELVEIFLELKNVEPAETLRIVPVTDALNNHWSQRI
jgi:hypothetical protein